jgi:uncharacterized protein YjbJ (UPF0337 family)
MGMGDVLCRRVSGTHSDVPGKRVLTRRGERYMAQRNGIEEAVSGVVEGAKGKAKEVVGKVTDRDDLHREGQAQQDKAEAQRTAAKKEAEAESARGAAKANEAREAAEQ